MNKKTFKNAALLLMTAVVLALLVNTFSPAGIPLFGKWGEMGEGGRSGSAVNDGSVNAEEAKSIYDRGDSLFLDARSSGAYDGGHIKGAVSLPISTFDMRIEYLLDHYPPDQRIVTYCADVSCEDSDRLARLLIDFGYENVLVMADGFEGWGKKGFPVE